MVRLLRLKRLQLVKQIKTPLAILENILQDAKKKSEGKTTGAGGQPTPSVEERERLPELVNQLIQRLRHRNKLPWRRKRHIKKNTKLSDNARLRSNRRWSSSSYRKRHNSKLGNNKERRQRKKAQASTAGDGYEIEQLTTTKIPVPDSADSIGINLCRDLEDQEGQVAREECDHDPVVALMLVWGNLASTWMNQRCPAAAQKMLGQQQVSPQGAGSCCRWRKTGC